MRSNPQRGRLVPDNGPGPRKRAGSQAGAGVRGVMTGDAVLLAGPLGLGHEMMARCCADLLERSGWRTRSLDSMSLLGAKSGGAAERLFSALIAVPGLYDGLHFAHLRTG